MKLWVESPLPGYVSEYGARKQKDSEENLSQSHFVQHKPQENRRGSKSGPAQ
jgi:hypothetical protein